MTFACHEDDVPLGEGRTITLEGVRLALFRADTGWYATAAACPHAGGPLADGIVCDHAVTCPLHDRRFDLTTGESASGERVATYPVDVRDGRVFVAVRVVVADAAATAA